MTGSRRLLEVTFRFVESADEGHAFISNVKHHWNGAVAGGLNHRPPHFGMGIHVELGVAESLPIQEVLEGSAVPTEIARVHEKIALAGRCVFENQLF